MQKPSFKSKVKLGFDFYCIFLCPKLAVQNFLLFGT